MNPKPFASLNHFTVPLAMSLLYFSFLSVLSSCFVSGFAFALSGAKFPRGRSAREEGLDSSVAERRRARNNGTSCPRPERAASSREGHCDPQVAAPSTSPIVKIGSRRRIGPPPDPVLLLCRRRGHPLAAREIGERRSHASTPAATRRPS